MFENDLLYSLCILKTRHLHMLQQNPYLVKQKQKPVRLSMANSLDPAPFIAMQEDEDALFIAMQEDEDALFNHPVSVKLIFYNRCTNKPEADTMEFCVSRAAQAENEDLLSDIICDFLAREDEEICTLGRIRVDAYDENGEPCQGRLLFDRATLPADVLDKPSVAGYTPEVNRCMNIRAYIIEKLDSLLYHDMLNLDTPDRLAERKWTIALRN